MGGAMDLVSGVSPVTVLMLHTHNGERKIVEECSEPLTGRRCVTRIITDMCIFDVDPAMGLTLVELAEGTTVEDVAAATVPPFAIAEHLGTTTKKREGEQRGYAVHLGRYPIGKC
jgi:3-oxoacid CoA-transferase